MSIKVKKKIWFEYAFTTANYIQRKIPQRFREASLIFLKISGHKDLEINGHEDLKNSMET